MDIISVSLEALRSEPHPVKIERQIVAPPEDPESQRAPDAATKLLSDRDFTAEREQVHRGDAPDAGVAIGKSGPRGQAARRDSVDRDPAERQPPVREPPVKRPPDQKPPASQPARRQQTSPARPERPRQEPLALKLDNATVFQKFAVERDRDPAKADPQRDLFGASNSARTNPRPFSRPAGSGAAFIGNRGANDFLPNLPDGDITLLNAKADRFAVFVRRVATQVFAQLRQSGWETLQRSDVFSIDDYSTVHAIVGPDGMLKRVMLEGASGSGRFDDVVLTAARKGTRDPNPPPEALAADGNYHFIFKAKSWSQIASSARTGAPFERRWLLLMTGLE